MKLLKKTVLSAAVGLAFASVGVAAQAATWNVLGGSFNMAGVGGTPSIAAGNPGTLIEGSYQSAGTILSNFIFFGNPVSTYTAATGVDGVNHAAPSINLGAMTADMGSFYAFWNGTEFNQGGNATVTALGGGNYRLAWSSLIVGGPFNGYTGQWTMDVAPVPVPAAAWLLGSGLLGLVGVARRRKAS